MTDFPVDDNKFPLTLSKKSETATVKPHCPDRNTVVLKHVLHKPARKSRIVRSISIGHNSNERFSLSKFRSGDSRSASLDNRVHNGNCENGKTGNGVTEWPGKCLRDPQKHISSPFNLSSLGDQISFGSSSLSEASPLDSSSPALSPSTPNNNTYNHNELSSLPSLCSPSPPGCRTPTPYHSSTSSIPSLSSLNSSDPPTPRSPSPTDRGQTLLRQSSSSSASSQDNRHASSSSTLSSISPSPSPSLSPAPSIILSTHSAAALKMGTQQLIPKGLASDIRQKAPPSGLLGLGDHSKRSLKALSMVETGTYFSTGGGQSEGKEGESESPGSLRRGLRSTSYRRAVVSGVDLQVPSVDPGARRFTQPVIRRLNEDCPDAPVSPASPGAATLNSPGSTKPVSSGLTKMASPKISKLPSLRTEKPTINGKNKVGKTAKRE